MFRQKDPKPGAPGRGPSGAFATVPKVRAAELALLKQSSPLNRVRDRGAATPAGALRWRHGMARGMKTNCNDTGFPITTAGRGQEGGKVFPRRLECLLFCHSRGTGIKWGGSRNAGIHPPRVLCLMKQQTEETWIPIDRLDSRLKLSGMTDKREVPWEGVATNLKTLDFVDLFENLPNIGLEILCDSKSLY